MIRILHISDVHFGGNDRRSEQALIVDAVIKAVSLEARDLNAIIFSGDLAFSGERTQFEAGSEWLARLCSVAPTAGLVVVPGNHDVQRNKVKGPALLHAAGSNEKSYDDWKKETNDRPPPHLAEYFSWLNDAQKSLPLRGKWSSPYGVHYTFEDFDLPLHVIGLNSVLLSCDDHDEKNLVIDVKFANECLYRCKANPGVVVAVAHHPFEHLVGWNRAELEKFLSQGTGADLYLHGHLHSQLGTAKIDITGRSLITLGAGAAYQGSTWPQQFAIYTIDATQRALQAAVFTYSIDSGEWVQDNKLSGALPLDLPRPTPDRAKGAAVPPQANAGRRERPDEAKPKGGSKAREGAAPGAASNPMLELEVRKYRDAAREVEAAVAPYLRENSEIAKICYAIKHRVKNLDRIHEKMSEKSIHDARQIVDICGFRLITFYQCDIPAVVDHLLKVIEKEEVTTSPFARGCSVEIDINTSRTESDPLSISRAVQEIAAKSPLQTKVEVKSRPTGYSSVHLVVLARTKGGDHGIREMFLELQIRSAWEDVWGEIDHRLRYGSERGGMGVSWSRHLNVFKALIDGVVQYVDVIKRQSEEDTPKSPSTIKVDRTIATPDDQLTRLRRLPPHILNIVTQAFELWKQADASRQRGGDPGLLRQAADAFANIIAEFAGELKEAPELAEELTYVAEAERAYLLTYTGDDIDLAQAAELYRSILDRRPDDGTALFRLGIVRRRQGQLGEADRLLTRALKAIESGEDDRLSTEHWTYDIARLGLGLTRWRIFNANGAAEILSSALALAKSVVDDPVDPENLLRGVNDYLYYVWEARRSSDIDPKFQIDDAEFEKLTRSLQTELNSRERSYEYHDTLVRALYEIGAKTESLQAALRLRDLLEQAVILRAPDLKLPAKGGYAWTVALSRYLDPDQLDSLGYAQDLIRELS